MNISAASTKIKVVPSQSGDNNDIKLLEKQKEKLQAQIQKVKESKIDDKLKQERIKELQDQINDANTDIQRIRAEQLKQNNMADAASQQDGSDSKEEAANKEEKGDSLELSGLIKTSATYSNIKTMNKAKIDMSNRAEILKNEIKRDEIPGYTAKEKRAEVSKMEEKIGALDEKMGKSQKNALEGLKENSSSSKTDLTERERLIDEDPEQSEEEQEKAHKKIDVRV